MATDAQSKLAAQVTNAANLAISAKGFATPTPKKSSFCLPQAQHRQKSIFLALPLWSLTNWLKKASKG